MVYLNPFAMVTVRPHLFSGWWKGDDADVQCFLSRFGSGDGPSDRTVSYSQYLYHTTGLTKGGFRTGDQEHICIYTYVYINTNVYMHIHDIMQ